MILNSRMNAKRSKQKKYQIEYLNLAMEEAEKDIVSYNTKILESIEKKELLRSQLIELLAEKDKDKVAKKEN